MTGEGRDGALPLCFRWACARWREGRGKEGGKSGGGEASYEARRDAGSEECERPDGAKRWTTVLYCTVRWETRRLGN